MIKKIFLMLVVFLLGVVCQCFAATYYIATNGSDSANGTTTATAWATFNHAINNLTAGDTLIVRDGTYPQYIMLSSKSGTAANWITIRAEHNFEVTLTGALRGSYYSALEIGNNSSYIKIEGIKFKLNSKLLNQGVAILSYGANHIKIIRCSFTGAYEHGNLYCVNVGATSSYILLEECWAWGVGRYIFLVYQASNVVLRRCVSRFDWADVNDRGGQSAPFCNYDATDTVYENCIAIDSGVAGDDSTGGLWGGWWCENNGSALTNGKILGCIVLNVKCSYGCAINNPKIYGTHLTSNTVIWDCDAGYGANMQLVPAQSPSTPTLTHMTIGNITGTDLPDRYEPYGSGASASLANTDPTISNSIVYGCHDYGIRDYMVSDYNQLYANGDNYGGYFHTPTPGAHDIYTNPNLTDITDSGNDTYGARIIYQIGVAETLYGEEGYDTLTAVPLWPFPNEAEIQEDFRTYTDYGVDGSRGFCAAGQTLTNYIKGYLGDTPDPEETDTYYVSTTGSDSADGSSTTPWLTLQHAVDTVVAGDTVIVNAGSYAGFNQWDEGHDGTTSEPITIRANGTVTLTPPSSHTQDVINIENNDYWIIDGFICTGATRSGIRVVNARGVQVKNNTCHDNSYWNIFTGFAPELLIEDNTCYNTTVQHNIYVSNSNSSPDRPIIRGNTCYNATQNGIQLNGDPESGGDGVIEDAIIENNILYNNLQNGLKLISVSGSTIQNNIIHNNGISGGAGGIHLAQQLEDAGFSINNSIVNNTIYETAISAIRINSGANTGNIVFNNIAVSTSGSIIVFEGSGNYQSSNLATATITGLFTDYENADFTLAVGSAAINAGVSTYQDQIAPSVDINGDYRPQDALYDCGAYESAGTVEQGSQKSAIMGMASLLGKVGVQ